MREVKPWAEYWMSIAWKATERSKDPSTQVACVIVDEDQTLLSTGYNGFPPGYPDTPEVWNNKPQKYECVIHAECNAVGRAARKGVKLSGATVYITHHPCLNCAKTLLAAGIKKLVYNTVVERFPEEEMKKARDLMEASGVTVEKI